MRIVVVGNSVALRVRPPRADAQQRTYAEWLRDMGHEVRVVARAGVILTEAFATLDDDVVSAFPDCVILNHGVVESCPRRVVRWINNRTIRNYYLNEVVARPYVPDTPASRLTLLLWKILNVSIKRGAGVLGLRWQWTSRGRFLEVMERTIGVILKETSAGVVVLGINPTTSRIELQLDGSARALAETNVALRALCERLGPRVAFVEPASYLKDLPVEAMVPDGIHFSAEGHRRTAEALRPFVEHSRTPAAG